MYYPICIHLQPAYRYLGYQENNFPHAEQAANEVFSIPMHPFLDVDDQQKIVSVLNSGILEEVVS